MAVCILLLRGINVGGKNSISMAELTDACRKAGCTDITTYIQSGNVVFEHQQPAGIAAEIERILRAGFGINIRAIIRTPQELENSAANNPFLAEPDIDLKNLHVTFLAEKPENILNMNGINYPPDRYQLIGKDVFVHCPDGYGRTKLTNTLFENTLKTAATTRNWNTVVKLLNIVGKYSEKRNT